MKQNRKLVSFSGWALLAAAFLTAGGIAPSVANAQTTKTTTQVQTRTESKKIKVDVNAADVKTLESLPGIGPVLAQKIIAGRPYRNVADLGKVKGLSETKLNLIKDDVSFGSPITTTPKSEVARTQKEKTVVAKTTTAETKTSPRETSTTVQTTIPRSSRVEPLTPTGRNPRTLAAGTKININTATAEELDRLPGIGPVKAKAIVDYRAQIGKFKSIEDVEKVKGIKAGEFSKIKDSIELGD
jgi:competence protein ComEA